MPSTAAISSTASTASGDSICAIPSVRARAASTGSGLGAEARAAVEEGDPARARRAVVQRRRPRLGLLGRVDLRAHHALDAEVEGAGGAAAHVGLHAHQRVHAGGARAQQLRQQLRLVAAAVLEVDEQPVEAGQAERLGRQRRAERQEAAEQGLAGCETGLHRCRGRHRPLKLPGRGRQTRVCGSRSPASRCSMCCSPCAGAARRRACTCRPPRASTPRSTTT